MLRSAAHICGELGFTHAEDIELSVSITNSNSSSSSIISNNNDNVYDHM